MNLASAGANQTFTRKFDVDLNAGVHLQRPIHELDVRPMLKTIRGKFLNVLASTQ